MQIQRQKLVFVYLGNRLPRYARKSVVLAQKLSGLDVVLVTERRFWWPGSGKCERYILGDSYKPELIETDIDEKRAKFRNGFWLKTTERFFALNEYMRNNNINECFHAELDNLVFANNRLAIELNNFGSGLFVPFDSPNRAIASFMFVNSNEILAKFCRFAAQHIGTKNDMELLALFGQMYSDEVFALPTNLDNETLNAGLSAVGIQTIDIERTGIFDAAAIGQWYFGIDPRNSFWLVRNQFVNDVAEIDMKSFRMQWSENKSSFEAFMVGALQNKYLVNNLHIHSKIFKKISRKTKLLSIVSRTDASERVLISLNLRGLLRATAQIALRLSVQFSNKLRSH
jgi:hypothetical protein